MKSGVELITDARKRQIKRGNNVEYDIESNPDGELLEAAIATISGKDGQFPAAWNDLVRVQKICDKDLIPRLAIAGALIAAEIDRLQNTNQ